MPKTNGYCVQRRRSHEAARAAGKGADTSLASQLSYAARTLWHYYSNGCARERSHYAVGNILKDPCFCHFFGSAWTTKGLV